MLRLTRSRRRKYITQTWYSEMLPAARDSQRNRASGFRRRDTGRNVEKTPGILVDKQHCPNLQPARLTKCQHTYQHQQSTHADERTQTNAPTSTQSPHPKKQKSPVCRPRACWIRSKTVMSKGLLIKEPLNMVCICLLEKVAPKKKTILADLNEFKALSKLRRKGGHLLHRLCKNCPQGKGKCRQY